MTIAGPTDTVLDDLDPESEEDEPLFATKFCEYEGCNEPFVPKSASAAVRRKYCDTHVDRNKRKGGKDRPPLGIRIDLGQKATPKNVDPAIAALEQRAAQLLGLVALLVFMLGQPDDAGDLERGSAGWAKAVAELAEYEPWLKKLAAGGETSERLVAWLKLAMATGTIALPILLRHEVLPAFIAQLFESAVQAGAGAPVNT